jgi:hypothetical protein
MKAETTFATRLDAPLALFVDGENLSHVHANTIIDQAGRLGPRAIRRVYGAAARVAKWSEQGTFRIVDCGSGKNGADVMLALEALEAVLLAGFRHVAIASSDGDFTPLALKLAEHGVRVTGIGEAKAPEAFRKACARFVVLPEGTPPKTPSSPAPIDPKKIERWLETEIGQAREQKMSLQALGSRMAQKYGVTKAQLPVADWVTFLRQLERFELVETDGHGRIVMFAKKRPPGDGGLTVID